MSGKKLDNKTLNRFMNKVFIQDDNCWRWTSSINYSGYAHFWYKGQVRRAHRVIYEHYFGEIVVGFELDHKCKNRWCVNPDHLEEVTHKENVRRGNVKFPQLSKTHCPYNHPYSGENLSYSKEGWRRCKACARRKYRERKMRTDEERRY